MAKKTTYQEKKEMARQEAIDWQTSERGSGLSYGELAIALSRFEKLGKKYGLMREFKENGIL